MSTALKPMFSTPMTRKDLQESFGLKGKALTNFIKEMLAQRVFMRRLIYTNPAKHNKRKAVYQTYPKQTSISTGE